MSQIAEGRKTKYQNMLNELRSMPSITWFDLGLHLDKINENRDTTGILGVTPATALKTISNGIAFITFDFGIDGVSIEVAKYAKVLENLIKNETGKKPKIHCIAETIKSESSSVLNDKWKKTEIKGAGGFVDWDCYEDFFKTKQVRGSDEYNKLILKIWDQTLNLTEKIGKYVIENKIDLLIPVNICSNPGNVPLTLCMVFISEYLQIPVINNNHDFYWEDGSPEWIQKKHGKNGLRDHFFTNAHIGEIQSIVDNIFPWNSPLWFHTVLNNTQFERLIYDFGVNPSQLAIIPTIVDLNKYHPATEHSRYKILKRIQYLFSNGKKELLSEAAPDFTKLPDNWYKSARPLFLGAKKGLKCDLTSGNLLFLQPTRILPRKQIERDLLLIESMLSKNDFKQLILEADLTITLLVSGPVTKEHVPYVNKLIKYFKNMISELDTDFKDRIFLAFKFGIESNKAFDKKGYPPLEIYELYQVANIILLPSHQEGRGLPIIEGSACGVPVFATRYFPQEVFAEVIGESLEKDLRLSVFEIPSEGPFNSDVINKIVDFFSDPQFNSEDLQQNISVVKKRFSDIVLENFFNKAISTLSGNSRITTDIKDSVKLAFETFEKSTRFGTQFKKLTLSKNRKYLPGLTRLENMVYLKSLVDPCFFRMEEKYLLGRIYKHAHQTILKSDKYIELCYEEKLKFYRQIQFVFNYFAGEKPLIVDHSLSYRHRHRKNYPYRSLTEPELRGIIGILLQEIFPHNFYMPPARAHLRSIYMAFPYSIKALAGTKNLAIDDSSFLENDLMSNRPIGWVPGKSFTLEAIIFVDRTMRKRLKISHEEVMTEELLNKFDPEKVGPITLFVKGQYIGGNSTCYEYALNWIKNDAPEDIKLLYKKKFLKVVKTNIISSGFHLGQLGTSAEKNLVEIKEKNGFILSVGNNNLLTMDLLNIDCYHIGFCSDELFASFLGIEKRQGYILRVPAGLRPSLAYPTPIQTPKEFADAFNSKEFIKVCKKLGTDKFMEILREDADKYGTPVKVMIDKYMDNTKEKNLSEQYLEANLLTGLFKDGTPYSGAYIKTLPVEKQPSKKLQYTTGFSSSSTDTVMDIINSNEKLKVVFAWNGGYILNNELIGRLAMSSEYVGAPLGLLINNGIIYSLPLFNKPALAFDKDCKPHIIEATMDKGVTIISKNKEELYLSPESLNNPKADICFYNLMYPKDRIEAEGRTLYCFIGNHIFDIISDDRKSIPNTPVGLIVSVKKGQELKGWEKGLKLDFKIPGWENIVNAIEAGPRLIRNCKESIEMKNGGWLSPNSIRTQAARMDYTHMRGPKIGVGVTKNNELIVVAINGRIRESEGCTHSELSSVLLKMGAFEGMGFDPGGSVTLIVDNKQLNITPYNKGYIENHYSLPPEPRFVGNAVIAHL